MKCQVCARPIEGRAPSAKLCGQLICQREYYRRAQARCRGRPLLKVKMSKPLDLEGEEYGLLRAISPTQRKGRRAWRCRCQCGQYHVVSTTDLRGYRVQSCGAPACRKEVERLRKLYHG